MHTRKSQTRVLARDAWIMDNIGVRAGGWGCRAPGGKGALTPNFGRYVPRQSEKWGGGAAERLERENAGLWSELKGESGSL